MGNTTEAIDFLRTRIKIVEDKLYCQVAEKRGCDLRTVHTGNFCRDIDFMHEYLSKLGLNNEIIKAEMVSRGNFHRHLLIDREFHIDPFWQQFLVEPNPNMPRVFIAHKAGLEDSLNNHGIPHKNHFYWLFAVSETRYVYVPGSELSEPGIPYNELDFILNNP